MVQIEHLNKVYPLKSGDVTALKDVSLTINKGEIFGVIGYSGAGKSSLVRCLNLLEKPDSGNLFIEGVPLVQTHTDEQGKTHVQLLADKELNQMRKQIGMIFQHFNLLDRSTVFDNIAYPLKYAGKSKAQIKARVKELLELVDLSDKIDAYPSQLSGGQKQRVAIARALANHPKILLSDEATSALDPEATESILQLLQKLNKELGLTIVMITHEMSVIKTVCDRVAVMEQGAVVEMGETYQIFADPKEPITKRFVNSTSGYGQIQELLKRKAEILENRENGALYLLKFTKDSLSQAAVSRISRTYQVDMDILLANIELMRGGALGRMLVAVSGETDKKEAALLDLKQSQVLIQEVTEDELDRNFSA